MADTVIPRALIDGQACALADAAVPVLDEGFARGDGAFEAIGVWNGRPFRLADHLVRLAGSLAAIGLPAPDLALLEAEARSLLDGIGPVDAALRCFVTASGTRVLTLVARPQRPELRHLVPLPAPWIRPLGSYGPAGAKSMSYGPNMASSRAARAAGGDDALLVSLEGFVLEGPTFGVLWVDDGTLRAPEIALGIVDSISRRTVLEAARAAGLAVEEGRYPLAALAAASELLICSSPRELQAVERAGEYSYPAQTPVRDLLAKALDSARRSA